MQTHDEKISEALRLLEDYPPDDETRPPAVAFFPPDQRSFFRGNRDGFVKLAVAALHAAQGKQQKFDKGSPWFHAQDLDWSASGLQPDESAHIYLPPKKTRFREMSGRGFGFALFLIFVLLLTVGGYTISKWIFR